jgi:hypothetical protein
VKIEKIEEKIEDSHQLSAGKSRWVWEMTGERGDSTKNGSRKPKASGSVSGSVSQSRSQSLSAFAH